MNLIYFALAVLFSIVVGERVQLTCNQIRAFVDGHNIRRQKVAKGLVPGQPAASDMQFMIWDAELAEKASSWASNGEFAHNPDRVKRWNMVGENIYNYNYYSSLGDRGEINIDNALKSWFEEYKFYNFEPFFLDVANPFGHYTQMIWADTNRVGCGISQTSKNNHTKTLFVCDYGPTGNYLEQKPYKSSGAPSLLQCGDGNCNKPYGPYC